MLLQSNSQQMTWQEVYNRCSKHTDKQQYKYFCDNKVYCVLIQILLLHTFMYIHAVHEMNVERYTVQPLLMHDVFNATEPVTLFIFNAFIFIFIIK